MNENEFKCFQLLCRCSWKRHIKSDNDVKDLFEYEQTKIQKSIFNDKKIKRKRKFRCPSCGYAVSIETITDIQNKLDVEAELKLKKQEIEELEKSIKSTTPIKKKENL
jgi:hypothetical protein